MATYVEQSLLKIKEFEGCIPWMYRDTAGKVTVGVGLMLPDVAAAAALPFQIAGRAATVEEIAAEFARVMALGEGKAAIFYRKASSPVLVDKTIDAKLREVLEGFEAKLRAAMNGYDGFPERVKLALLDMAYNLGPGGLLKGYPRLVKAVEQGRWADAAADCERHGPDAARNSWTREQFLGTVAATIKAEAETCLKSEGWLRRLRRRLRSL
jgi:GH24 family phage-related lysozyme (muramidase)